MLKFTKKKGLLIYLIDATHRHEEGMLSEFGDEKSIQFKIFSSFDECSKYLNKLPDVIIMDQPETSFITNRIKTKVDNVSKRIKLIFISDGDDQSTLNELQKHGDDYLSLNDESLYTKIKISVEELAFLKAYNEDYSTEPLTVNGYSKYILPTLFLILGSLISIITFFS